MAAILVRNSSFPILLARYFGQKTCFNLMKLGAKGPTALLCSKYKTYFQRQLENANRHFCNENKAEDSKQVGKKSKIDFRNDPQVRSILEEISQHFQEGGDPSSGNKTRTQLEHDKFHHTSKKDENESDITSRHLKDKFSVYDNAEESVILDVDEELELLERQEEDGGPSVDDCLRRNTDDFYRQRGLQGVFDIHQLIDVLLMENTTDVCVIEVSPHLLYADYLVVVSGRSTRHLRAIAEFVNKLYKAKKTSKDDFIVIQGENSQTWLALDLGNIVLHLFLPEERAKYDIEMLWSVGSEYDDSCRRHTDVFDEPLQAHLQYLDKMRPLRN